METPLRDMYDDDNDNGEDDYVETDETAAAYQIIQAQLEQWTSPRITSKSSTTAWTDVSAMNTDSNMDGGDDDDDGMVLTGGASSRSRSRQPAALSSAFAATASTQDQRQQQQQDQQQPRSVYKYERNVMDWWNRELVDPIHDDDNDDDDDDEMVSNSNRHGLNVTRTPSKQQHQQSSSAVKRGTPVVERSATPIMSNSSRKKLLAASANKQRIVMAANNNFNTSTKASPSFLSQYYNNDNNINQTTTEENHHDAAIAEDDDNEPVGVQTPAWIRQQEQQQKPFILGNTGAARLFGTAANDTSTTPRAISPFQNEPYEYRRYHDSLKTFLTARRSLSDRIAMDREAAALSSSTFNATATALTDADSSFLLLPSSSSASASGGIDPKLTQEETLVELEFLRTLKAMCWERDPLSSAQQQRDVASRREGDCWALLAALRQTGLAAMLWADDDASVQQNGLAGSAYLERKALDVHATPKELIDELAGSNGNNNNYDQAPLVLRRRQHILTWLEHCLDQLVTVETKASVSMAATSGTSGASSTTTSINIRGTPRHLDKVMKSCLSLLLAGRLEDARLLLRTTTVGQPWVAAKLSGGAPAGFVNVAETEGMVDGEVQEVKVGNVNRSLWKRQMWKLSAKMSKNITGQDNNSQTQNAVTPEEAAVHQILANDYRNAMENVSLRTWEKGLYVLLHAMWGRTEDELLHVHNNHRRKERPPFPGTLYEQQEKEQLQDTCQLANLTEIGAVGLLAASPFQGMKGLEEQPCRASAALLVGRHALVDFLAHETHCLTGDNNSIDDNFSGSNNDDSSDQRVSRLRFVTHILLYLDSLDAGTTPVSLQGIRDLKDRALFAYVNHLAGHEDLWHYVVLYASLMPDSVILHYFPAVLARVEGDGERKMMTQQARECFATPGLDLQVTKAVVRLMLAQENGHGVLAISAIDEDDVAVNDTSTPTQADVRKMKAIHWLYFYKEHIGDALLAANMLLRQFLMANKFASAIMFLQDFLPSDVVDTAMTVSMSPTDDDNEDDIRENEIYRSKIGAARAEHVAFQSYLKAFRAVDEWNLVLSTTPISGGSIDEKVDPTALNEPERAIAKSMERRELIRQKRKVGQVIVAAAETARRDIMKILLQEGGWLVDSKKVDGMRALMDNSAEGCQRKIEIQALRSRLLPHAVKLLHQVCENTAGWMWSSLLDASPELGATPKEVLDALDDAGQAISPLSPTYWTQQALNVVEIVSSDEHMILQAFGAADLKEMLAKLSDISLSELMYSA